MMNKMIWSDSQEQMVHAGFSRYANGFRIHYTWDDADELYRCDECDDEAYFEIPKSTGRCSVVVD